MPLFQRMHISETGRKGVSGSIKGGVGANGLSEAVPVRLTGLSSERADSQMSVSRRSHGRVGLRAAAWRKARSYLSHMPGRPCLAIRRMMAI